MKVTGKKTLKFTKTAWDKMWGMTLRCKDEVSGLGIVDENDPCKVVDFFIVEQSCTASTTEMDQDAVANLIADMRDKGVNPSRWRVWWHSHASMKTFFSGTDEDNVERYASEKALWSVVTNHEDAKRVAAGKSPTEMYIRIDLFDPDHPKSTDSPMRYTIEGCDWHVAPVTVVGDEWFDEAMKKVGRPTVQKLNIKPAGNEPSHWPSGWWQDGKGRFEGPLGRNLSQQEDVKDDPILLVSHYAIDDFLDEDVISLEAAVKLSDQWQSKQLSEAELYNELVEHWNKYLEGVKADHPLERARLRKQWSSIQITLAALKEDLGKGFIMSSDPATQAITASIDV